MFLRRRNKTRLFKLTRSERVRLHEIEEARNNRRIQAETLRKQYQVK